MTFLLQRNGMNMNQKEQWKKVTLGKAPMGFRNTDRL